MRLQYWDGSSYVFDDDIDMSETAVNASYTMSLYPGSLDQGLVKAVLTVGDESIEAEALAGTGTLTVLSTVNKDGNTTEIGRRCRCRGRRLRDGSRRRRVLRQ